MGGTCNQSGWRADLIKELKIGYFQPMGDDWTPEMMEEEIRQRANCDYCLYTITPKMTGVYSIAELVEDSIRQPGKTVFCFLEKDGKQSFTPAQIRSLEQVGKLIMKHGARFFRTLRDVANFLNNNK